MWSRVGTLHLQKGENRLCLTDVKSDARIDHIYLGLYPPFVSEPRLRIPATDYQNHQGGVTRIDELGYAGGVLVLPFDTPSYSDNISQAPYVDYELDLREGDSRLEVRTLPSLRVYEGRDARYAIQVDNAHPQVFSIHEDDFTAEWRWNVLRGYATRSVDLNAVNSGHHRVRIYLLDPGIVLQELLVH